MIAVNAKAPGAIASRVALGAFLLVLAAAFAPAAPASAAVQWESEVYQAPSNLPPGGRGILWITPSNIGSDTSLGGWPVVSFELPPGVEATPPEPPHGWSCSGSPTVTCVNPLGGDYPVMPKTSTSQNGAVAAIRLTVAVAPWAAEGSYPFDVAFAGGGAADPVVRPHLLRVGSEQLGFGPTPGSFGGGAFDKGGADYTQAGGHPYEVTTSFRYNTRFTEIDPDEIGSAFRSIQAEGLPRDVVAALPPGLIGDPGATPRCPGLKFVSEGTCQPATQIGVASISPPGASTGRERMYGIYNVAPAANHPAEFAFSSPIGNVVLVPTLRSNGDYGLSATVRNISQADTLFAVRVTLWGVPADPGHNSQRCSKPNFVAQACVGYDVSGTPIFPEDAGLPHDLEVNPRPFISNPTECSGLPVQTRIHLSQYGVEAPFDPFGDPDLSAAGWRSATATSPPLTGCELLEFDPSIVLRPATALGDSPSGLHIQLDVPQSEDPSELATAHLRDAILALPEGMSVNAAAAGGLGACSTAQIGLVSKNPLRFDKFEPACPLASKIGTARVDTPLLEDPLAGDVFLADQSDNPFGTLLGIYLVVRGHGLILKLAVRVDADPVSGDLTATITESPQVPFERIDLDLKTGPRAPLVTPGCGTHASTATLTSWAAPGAGLPAADSFRIALGPNGRPCTDDTLEPTFAAGTLDPVAGGSSPFVLNLSRDDGTGHFTAIDVAMPEGLSARLADIPYCPEAAIETASARRVLGGGAEELASPSCPRSSRVGTAIAGVGAGANPFYLETGKVYLSGPYKGAPLSLVAVLPAVAGPFDLGVVVDRIALRVNPKSAQVSAAGDPIPTVLQGIPLNLRDLRLALDRPGFVLNPTDCSPTRVDAIVHGRGGAAARVADRFRVGACARLGFKPRISLRFLGPTHRSAHPALRVELATRRGDANLRRAVMVLPGTELLDSAQIRTICSRNRYAEDACPAGAVYGYAKAWSPLLDRPLQGPIYLRSSNRTLPDIVASLGGQIHVGLVGRVDTVNARLRGTFAALPDVPLGKLVLTMHGDRKGLLVNNTELCRATPRASVKLGGQNGRVHELAPLVRADCGKRG